MDNPLVDLNVVIVGENRIAYVIKNNILLISNKDAVKKYDINIEISKNKKIKIKDKTGKVTRYELSIRANLTIKDKATQKNINKSFSKSSGYQVSPSHTNTIANEKSVIKNLTQQLSDELTNFIIFSNKN
tara:strand:- start:199 stop:588 length:390 start_codon:yes stop_codon:yes gene_type:complete